MINSLLGSVSYDTVSFRALSVIPGLSLRLRPGSRYDTSRTITYRIIPPLYLISNIIIPLRPYLEKIKGCRRPEIFRIQPWARHSRIVSGSEFTRITVRFTLTRWHAHVFSVQQRRVWTSCFACFFVLTLSTLCRIKSISFCSFKKR